MCNIKSLDRLSIRVFRRAAALTLLPVVVALGGCGQEGETPVVAEALAEMEADNMVVEMYQVVTREGVREAVLEADTAFYYEDSTAVHLRGTTLTIYTEAGVERARVTARRGRLDTETDEMVGRDDVVLRILAEDRIIRSEELHYSSKSDSIWSDSYTILEEAGQISCGRSFRSDLQFRELYIEEARTTGCTPVGGSG